MYYLNWIFSSYPESFTLLASWFMQEHWEKKIEMESEEEGGEEDGREQGQQTD